MYHAEKAPTGRIFDVANPSTPSLEQLHAEGWRDSAALVGVNVWNPNDDVINEKVRLMKEANDRGESSDAASYQPGLQAQVERYRQKSEYDDAALRAKDDIIAELERKVRERQEELADARSDAAKLRGAVGRVQAKRGTTPTEPDADGGEDPAL